MNDVVTPPPETRSYRRFLKGRFLYISIAFHVLLALVATYLVVQTFQPRKPTFKAGPKSSQQAPQREYKVKQMVTMSAPPQMKRIATAGPSKVTLPELPTLTATSTNPAMISGVGSLGMGTGPGTMGGGDPGGGPQVSIFGLRAKANSVVFIIDASGSMITGGRKSVTTWTTLEQEVKSALDGLPSSAQFNVILFAAGEEFFSTSPVNASEEHRQKAMEFIRRESPVAVLKPDEKPTGPLWRTPRGRKHLGTKPSRSLRRAFSWKPDVIIFISDGEPNRDTDPAPKVLELVQSLQKRQTKPVKINAIAYYAGGGQKFMEALARENDGEFKEITNRRQRRSAAEEEEEKEEEESEIGNAQ